MSRIAKSVAPANAYDEAEPVQVRRALALAGEQHPARDDRAPRPTMSGALAGSPRKTSAIVTETSGAVPKIIETRDEPDVADRRS